MDSYQSHAAAPPNENGAREGAAIKTTETGETLSTNLFPVKPRFCRPIAAAALAREIRQQLLARLETESDFAGRVRRTRSDARRKNSVDSSGSCGSSGHNGISCR